MDSSYTRSSSSSPARWPSPPLPPPPPWSDRPQVHEPLSALGLDSLQLEDHQQEDAQWPLHYVSQTCDWIKACNQLHGSVCVPEPISQRPPEDVPLWLIDTYDQCIVPGLLAHRYLALSYVWPESRASSDSATSLPPRTLLLDNASMKDFQQAGFLGSVDAEERIPAVIRHAIDFADALGERYLWVDRLCIVQDDVGDGGTLSQVGKMDKIYNGAYLTIIAAAPDKMYEKGCSTEWPAFESVSSGRRLRLWDDEMKTPRRTCRPPPRHLPTLDEDVIVKVMSARYVMLSRSRWATRGWTYQEQMLCKRAVVFIEDGYFWDCHCCVWDGVDLFPGQDFEGIALRADMGQRLNTRWWPDFSLYLDLICPYNGREFSYPQDAMLGITGVLNVLCRSFPGGFIHGLPRLFLDHALLWQPFGTAERRIDRDDHGKIHSSLPSWSWCGWQCHVDPWSLCSGLSYIGEKKCQQRGRSWRTRNLVQWYYSTGDHTMAPILEPCLFDQLVDVDPLEYDILADGWRHYDGYDHQRNFVNTDSYFVHVKDRHTSFSHPIPMDIESLRQSCLTTPMYLTCSTTTASLAPATVLVNRGSSSYCSFGPSKISVFEEKLFKDGPRDGKNCPVLVLQQPNGTFAGLLRLASKDEVGRAMPLELIAISTGSATARDMRSSFEWRIFETGLDAYDSESYGQSFSYMPNWISKKGKLALISNIATSFNDESAGSEAPSRKTLATFAEIEQRCTAQEKEHTRELGQVRKPTHLTYADSHDLRDWWKVRGEVLGFDVKDTFGSHRAYREPLPAYILWERVRRTIRNGFFFEMTRDAAPSDSAQDVDAATCEFYNVLWIERKDGVAYRRACGWVPKAVWEAHATGPVEIKLG